MARHKLLRTQDVVDKYNEVNSYTQTALYFGVAVSTIRHHLLKQEAEDNDNGEADDQE